MIPGPPAPLLDLALRLGLGPVIFDSPRNRELLTTLGIPPETARQVSRRLRRRSLWRTAWEEAATPHAAHAEEAARRGDRVEAIAAARRALAMFGLGYGGDNYYFYTPIPDRREAFGPRRRLYGLIRELTGDAVEELSFSHLHGETRALLHLPARAAGRVPALVCVHPMGGDKENFDFVLALFREAGYATLCFDLPAHGDGCDGPRLQPDDELVVLRAREVLAARPQIDPGRIGVLGASLGGFFALRAAALSTDFKVCVVYASGFDIGRGLPEAVRGIQEQFAWSIGAPNLKAAFEMARPYHLRDAVGKIRCPVLMVHGTQDHICDFTVPYQIARRITAPLTIHPILGADHEVAIPATPSLADPGIDWLRSNL